MDKAITILQDLLGYEEEAEAKAEIHEAIAELKAHKAKIDELKEWVKQQKGGKIAYWSDVLQKLEELEG